VSRLSVRNCLTALFGALVLLLGAHTASAAAQTTEPFTTTTVRCEMSSPAPTYKCASIVFGPGIGTNWLKDREKGQYNAMQSTFSGGGSFDRTVCSPAEVFADSTPDEVSCSVTFTPHGVGNFDVNVSFVNSQAVNEIRYKPSSGSTSVSGIVAPTQTSGSCPSPPVVVQGNQGTCEVTVTSAAADTVSPAGKVAFSADASLELTSGTCTLTASGARTATCSIGFKALAAGAARPKISVTYEGQPGYFQSSSGSALEPEVRARPTTTEFECTPTLVVLPGGLTSCVVRVKDTAGVGPSSQPTGRVTFGGSVGFSAPGCDLKAARVDSSSCSVNFAPMALGTAQITATYAGSTVHAMSQASVQLNVTGTLPTQGSGPSDPSGSSSAPNTTIKKHPRAKDRARTARFSFVSDQAGAKFQCKLDKAKKFKACRATLVIKKLKRGAHVLQVRAVNSSGVADPTPAKFRWRVL
jgi:hypothetical protein